MNAPAGTGREVTTAITMARRVLEQFAIADWNQGNDQRWDHPKCEDQRTADKEDDIERRLPGEAPVGSSGEVGE
jgi:hypothetical protein